MLSHSIFQVGSDTDVETCLLLNDVNPPVVHEASLKNLITGRTSLAKGACPERIEGGQAHKRSRLHRKSKFKRDLAGLHSLRELVLNEVKEGKLTKILSMTGIKNFKGDQVVPFKILAPRAGLGHYGRNILFLPCVTSPSDSWRGTSDLFRFG